MDSPATQGCWPIETGESTGYPPGIYAAATPRDFPSLRAATSAATALFRLFASFINFSVVTTKKQWKRGIPDGKRDTLKFGQRRSKRREREREREREEMVARSGSER